MNKTLFLIIFLLFTISSFSQSTSKELTEKEKDELRKIHHKSLTFTSSNKKHTSELRTSNTTEQDPDEVKKIKVKYYYGKEDSLYKDFEYTKPD